ncbi:unnamed protein product [Agarophyton chilense]
MQVIQATMVVVLTALVCSASCREVENDSHVVLGSGQFFDKIAARYDVLNQVISLGLHGCWRRSAIRKILPAKSVLDVSTGTGDLAISVAGNRSIRVVGLDPSTEMLKVAREKANRFAKIIGDLQLVEGVAEKLPFESESFDAVAVAFGVRNFQDIRKGLAEMGRVLRPGGRWVILEVGFTNGDRFLEKVYRIFVTKIMPKVAGFFSGNRGAYQYLSDSMQRFPEVEQFIVMLEEAGLHVETQERLTPLGMGPFLYSGNKSPENSCKSW